MEAQKETSSFDLARKDSEVIFIILKVFRFRNFFLSFSTSNFVI